VSKASHRPQAFSAGERLRLDDHLYDRLAATQSLLLSVDFHLDDEVNPLARRHMRNLARSLRQKEDQIIRLINACTPPAASTTGVYAGKRGES
jgi:hypothetical protein